MTTTPIKITGVILAGGLARRMNHQDKGLVLCNGTPLISYAIAAISGVTNQVLINANRNQTDYSRFGFPVINDQTDSFDGPLAGILTALCHSTAEILLVMPCDSPLIKAVHLQRLVTNLVETNAEMAVAFDGERLHPVFLALKTCLKPSLAHYLNSGERKMERWIKQHTFVKVDFSREPEIFLNLNTLAELSALEKTLNN
jgi:molybdopterin-guanine dinucleotide biosynthesis protein A